MWYGEQLGTQEDRVLLLEFRYAEGLHFPVDVEELETVHEMSGRLQRVMTVTVLAFLPQSTFSFL